jgi:hypothetical protein
MNDEFKILGKEADLSYLKVLDWHLHGGTKEKHEKPH